MAMLEQARQVYADASDECLGALEHIQAVAEGVQKRYPELLIHCDLSELRGYEYHTGLVFAAFLPGQGREIARGGRYDDIGSVFGVARPATGFSSDLLSLFQLSGQQAGSAAVILAPNDEDPELVKLVTELRQQGKRVITDLSDGALSAEQQSCQQELVRDSAGWQLRNVK